MDAQLQQLIELQAEQNRLLKRYLWRIRFSLLALLILTTTISCGLGFVIYTQQKPAAATIVPTVQWSAPTPSGTLRLGISPRPSATLMSSGSSDDLFGPPPTK
jgi:hypothetical protein